MNFDRIIVADLPAGLLGRHRRKPSFSFLRFFCRAGRASIQPLGRSSPSPGVQVFSVENWATDRRGKKKTTGLMYRKELPDGIRACLFDFSPGAAGSRLWMKNTYISLDMIFHPAADGPHPCGLRKSTEPLSTKIISSGGLRQGRAGGVIAGHRAENTASRPATGSPIPCSTALERDDLLFGIANSLWPALAPLWECGFSRGIDGHFPTVIGGIEPQPW